MRERVADEHENDPMHPSWVTWRFAPARRAIAAALAIACAGTSAASPPAAQPASRERRVTLSGANNLRDLGGYATSDGRRVRWGQVYRSDQLAQLTDQDYEQIARLGIATVCDFRRDDERQRAPTRWRGSNPPEILLRLTPPPSDAPLPDPTGTLTRGGSAEQVADAMRASYASNVTVLATTYGLVFKRILHEGPTLVHCTAGKDRTGIFSAIFLLLVGVPQATVEDDYLLSNTYYGTDARIESMARAMKTTPEAARALLGVDLSYLRAALAEIATRYGSIDEYRRTMLGLSDDDLTALKAKVLEPS